MIWLNKAYFPAEIHSQPAVSYTRRCWKLLFPPPTRRAVLRRRRQRDLYLWTPFLRCGGEWVRCFWEYVLFRLPEGRQAKRQSFLDICTTSVLFRRNWQRKGSRFFLVFHRKTICTADVSISRAKGL